MNVVNLFNTNQRSNHSQGRKTYYHQNDHGISKISCNHTYKNFRFEKEEILGIHKSINKYSV